MNSPDWRHRCRPPAVFLRRGVVAAAIVGLGLAASACTRTMSDFDTGGAGAFPAAAAAPVTLAPSDPQAVGGVARPAVLVDETTVPASSRTAPTTAPMTIAPQVGDAVTPAQPDRGIASAAVNLNEVPEQPKTKLLTPEEKAKVIAELERMAKKQGAALDKSKSTNCAADNLDPAQRVASATGDGGC